MSNTSTITTIDTRGFSCPQPILMVNSYLTEKNYPLLEVLVDNEASLENITRAAKKQAWQVEIEDIDANVKKLILTI